MKKNIALSILIVHFIGAYAMGEGNYMKYVKLFEEIGMEDVPLVGGKNASLGQMIQALTDKGIRIPTGFAITAQAYRYFLEYNKLTDKLKDIAEQLTDITDIKLLQRVGRQMRATIKQGEFPEDLKQEIIKGYEKLSTYYGQKNTDVAVRSSATAEDLPEASFAGQQETFLNVHGTEQLLESCKKCFASLFTDRAIIYRVEKGFDHFEVALSVGVQKMIRSDLACSGVMFTIDTETGFKDMIMINGAYGLGEAVVQGTVNPDEFRVHKPTLRKGFRSIVKKSVGSKTQKMIYAQDGEALIKEVPVSAAQQQKFCLSDDEILELARAGLIIEDYYSEYNNRSMPMDIEWAKDGIDGQLYILQARPETVHAPKEQGKVLKQYRFTDASLEKLAERLLVQGQSIGQQIASGKARVVQSIHDIDQFSEGDILVTGMTDPDWVPIMKKAAAIVTNRGGRTCHAAIVSRELGISAVIGAEGATQVIKDGQEITIDCSKGETGFVYNGAIPFEVDEIIIDQLPELPVSIMVNCADPDGAATLSFLPVDGVGLARLEFIISNWIKMHPMAAVQPDRVVHKDARSAIKKLTAAYDNPEQFFVNTLAQGIASIAAAFYPRPVIVRFSDFKSNEYHNLLGGRYFEPEEENPMLGLRGASRYYSPLYQPAFELECKAMKKVRDVMGLTNVKAMVPFVRTVPEAKEVLEVMKKYGLERGKNGLQVIMMCEVPSNVILVDEFLKLFDGLSIGSNDLTQMTLAVDRDSALLAPLFDERDQAVKKMLQMAVEGAKRNDKYSGICGQAPSDHPEIAQFLMDLGIDSLSLNADTVLPFIQRYNERN